MVFNVKRKASCHGGFKSMTMFQPFGPGLFCVRLIYCISLLMLSAPLLCFPSLFWIFFLEYTRYGKHQGQKALWGQPSRKLQKTSNRPVSFILSMRRKKKSWHVLHFMRFLLFLNSDHRAVEFFIRDKYEKKKYYSEKVTNGSSVCTTSSLITPCSVYKINGFCFASQRMLRRSGTQKEGAEPHPTAKWAIHTGSFPRRVSQIVFFFPSCAIYIVFYFNLFKERGIETSSKN